PGVALGYLGLPELTAERFVTEPRSGERLYRTGDLARMLPSGAIELRGRRDRQVKLRGFRIELEEIEQATMATGRCDAAFVEKVGEGPTASLVAFVLPTRGRAGDGLTEFLAGRLAERLPAYMVPARWVVLDDLRFGPTGKADREQLLSLLEDASGEASAAGAGGEASATGDGEASATGGDLGPVGEAIQQVWQEVLEVPRVSPGDGFLDLGGNSVMAVQVATRLQQRLGWTVEPGDILLAESLAELARHASTAVAARS
ncbi:MAG TPA: phosphopantetheine-binding protein, partial [Micromonosporaceae bacterium]|nr:phosphopantetheine-binding protein [Micromonosporaceae bacterium]